MPLVPMVPGRYHGWYHIFKTSQYDLIVDSPSIQKKEDENYAVGVLYVKRLITQFFFPIPFCILVNFFPVILPPDFIVTPILR